MYLRMGIRSGARVRYYMIIYVGHAMPLLYEQVWYCAGINSPPAPLPLHSRLCTHALEIPGDSDVFYLREAGVQYPELAELTQTLMPDDVAEEAGMTASSDGGGESSGDDDDDGDNIGGRNASRSEANRLKKKSRARQASKRRQKKAKESIAEYMPAVRRELQGAQTNLTSTTVAPAALDTERALNKYEADMSFQKVRMGRAEADKEVARRENRRNAREEYKRLRDELRKEEAEPERDEEFIAVLKGAAADALKSMKGE